MEVTDVIGHHAPHKHTGDPGLISGKPQRDADLLTLASSVTCHYHGLWALLPPLQQESPRCLGHFEVS